MCLVVDCVVVCVKCVWYVQVCCVGVLCDVNDVIVEVVWIGEVLYGWWLVLWVVGMVCVVGVVLGDMWFVMMKIEWMVGVQDMLDVVMKDDLLFVVYVVDDDLVICVLFDMLL